jgi:hypothetical protein
MARENAGWVYTRIVGALSNVGYKISRSTIANVLELNGIDPAPRRGKRTPSGRHRFVERCGSTSCTITANAITKAWAISS